ncbi:MAG: hypothetical protein ACI8XB_000871 [Patiriisocius sp.]|jgi:hypothetical protein
MFSSFLRKNTLSEDKLVNIFINAILKNGEEAFEQITDYLNETPEFAISPQLDKTLTGKFYLVIITGNIIKLTKEIHDGSERRMTEKIISKLSHIFQMNPNALAKEISACRKLMGQLNYPSKNVKYGMSRAFFHLYNLYPHQTEYFKDLKQPNPIVLKQLDQIMDCYLLDVEAYKSEYKIVQA